MKTQLLILMIAAGLLVGCRETQQHAGGAAETDQNVLTGGPMTGTTLKELPQSVRYALQMNAPSAEVADIEQTTWNGQAVYEIQFAQSGKNPKMYITQNGQILSAAQMVK